MPWLLVLQIIIFAIAGSLIYLIIGVIPGTDETSVLAPAALLLFAFNLHPLVILAFFIAAMTSLNLTDSIPTALTSIPGGVMSTPLVESSKYLKDQGLVTKSIRKMTSGSIYGTLCGLAGGLIVVGLVGLVTHLASFNLTAFVKQYSSIIFLFGAILLSLLSKKKFISLALIIPFGLVIVAAGKLVPQMSGTPYFLAITTGPLLFQLVSMIFPTVRRESSVIGNKEIILEKDEKFGGKELKETLGGKELAPTLIGSFLSSFLFFLSPVGVTMLVGEMSSQREKEPVQKAFTAVSAMNGIKNATYLSGILISLFAFRLPISPAALGPGGPLFNPDFDFLNKLQFGPAMVVIVASLVIALAITAFLAFKYANQITAVVFKYIPQEAVISLLIGLAFLLVFLDAGFKGVFLFTAVALIAGFYNKLGASYGVLFMAYYAAGFWQGLLS